MADETTILALDRSNAGTANIPERLDIVLDALANGIDPATLPPTITHGSNLSLLKSLPQVVRDELFLRGSGRPFSDLPCADADANL